MSKYTTEVRFICETEAGLLESVGYNDVDSVIQRAIPKIFDFDYPIFDEAYRNVLNTKILKHFYTKEIAFESVGLWKLHLNTTLNEIMPYYNQLYKSTLLTFNPLFDVDYTIQSKRDVEGSSNKDTSSSHSTSVEGESTQDGTGNGKSLYSDTPQGTVQNLTSETYLTNATFTNSTTHDAGTFENEEHGSTEGSEENTMTSTDSYLERVVGKRNGENYSKMLTDYRKTFLNIDVEVINALNDLFFSLW